MALYDEVRTIPYDSFDSQVECDKYDRASSAWDKFMQAALWRLYDWQVRPRHLRRCHLWLPEDCGHRGRHHRGVVCHYKVHSSKISQLITNA